MILVDTSLWISWIGKKSAVKEHYEVVTCGPILQEIIQGLRRDSYGLMVREGLLSLPRLSDPMPATTFLKAADIFHLGRQKGYTIRSSMDCLIAAIAIDHHIPVAHRDRDFDQIARFTSLEIQKF